MDNSPLSKIFARRAETRDLHALTLSRLDPKDPLTLVFAVNALLDVHDTPAAIAMALGVSRTTVGRWADNQTIPRSAPFRQFAVNELKARLLKVEPQP